MNLTVKKNAEKAIFEKMNSDLAYNLEYRQRISVKRIHSGRTGNKMGFSRQTKELRLRKSSFEPNVSSTGEFIADISNVICAGITETDSTAVKEK